MATMEYGLHSKLPLLFTQLPPEIRNIILRLTLVSNEALEIHAVNRDEYHKQLREGSYHGRTKFRMAINLKEDHSFGNPTERFETTYSLSKTLDRPMPSMAMLSLNEQTRKEATSIFYGLNTFSFTDLDCLVPFMLDRTAAVVEIIESFRLAFCLNFHKGTTSELAPIGGCDTWVQAVSDLAQFENLHLKRLVVDVEGQCNDLNRNYRKFDLGSPTTKWIPTLRGRISGLDMMGINYTCSPCTESLCFLRSPHDDTVRYLEGILEGHLWNLLAPHMLKKYNDDHNASTLQHRRILDSRSSEQDDFGGSSQSEFESEDETNEEEEQEEEQEEDEGHDQVEGEDKGDDHEAEEKKKEGRED